MLWFNLIKYKNLLIIPSYHGKINFSLEVRKAFEEIKPDAIAVELPESVRENIIKGVKRLPKLSLVIFEDKILHRHLFIPIDPGDSIIEGIRLSLEHNTSCYFIDLNVRAYNPKFKELPDDQALKEMNISDFYNMVKNIDPDDFNLDQEDFTGFPEFFVDLELSNETDEQEQNFEPNFLSPEKIILDQIDNPKDRNATIDRAREYYMACNLKTLMEDHENILVVVGLAHWERIEKYLEEDQLNTEVLKYEPYNESILYNVAPKNVSMVLNEVPYLTYQWENIRERNPINFEVEPQKRSIIRDNFDKITYIPLIFLKAIKEYEKRFEENISIQNMIQINQYLRNLVHYDRRLTPDIYHLLIAGKNIINDDFSWFVYKTAMYYPFAVQKDDDIETLSMKDGRFRFKGKMIKLHRRIPNRKRRRKVKIKRIKEERAGEDWRKEWEDDKYGICSYPEEDLILEERYEYFREIGHKTLINLFTKSEIFNGSFLDGIDIRETIRNWINGQKIYVKEVKKIEGNITDLIIIFDDEPLSPDFQEESDFWDEKYPHLISFYAEHPKESDLSFFSTTPGDNLIGPGISIIKIGGILSEYPPQSQQPGEDFFNIFDRGFNFFFRNCHMKSERLILGSIYQSPGKYIIYVAKKRPRNYFYNIAREESKKIVFIPISSFSPSSINRLKYMHILAGRYRRKYAHKYVNLKRKFKF
ncbi:MAG: hypothetical protein GY870_13330 [archaeon]|nr:hypothetical protein [archaeon]